MEDIVLQQPTERGDPAENSGQIIQLYLINNLHSQKISMHIFNWEQCRKTSGYSCIVKLD